MMIGSRSMLAGFFLLLSSFIASSQAGIVPGQARGIRLEAAVETGRVSPPAGQTTSNRDSENGVPHSAEGDNRIARADAHFNSGRQHYFQGDLAAARREFDLAVDTLLNAPDTIPDHRRIERRLDELCDLIYRFDVEELGSGRTEEAAVTFDKAPIDEITKMTFPADEALAPRLQSELNQTASGIPLELADPVMGYVHFFSSDRGKGILMAGFKRSGRYKALIERVFTEEGVPQELIYLAQAESGFLPRAVSYKNAVGMWQFIAGTGAIYQLSRSAAFDDRLDPEKATRAAARYLKDLYARYGDWYLAMAAYNCGAGAVDRAVERTGYADYWELLKRHALPRETANYVPAILAMTIIAKNAKDYGLENIELDPAVEYDTIQLAAATNLNLIADASMQPVSVIHDLNPSLLKTIAPSGYQVHVPKGSVETVESTLATVPEQNRLAWRLHHVLAGDTLDTIARSYHLTPDRIASVNRAADSIEAGDVLLIPAVYREESSPVRSGLGKRRGRMLLASSRSKKYTSASHGAHIAASRRVPAQALHRRATVRTASLPR
jgi:membrane-bound lytic murein transglycosylase D